MLSDEEKKALYMISLRRKGIPPNGGFIADNEEITIILNLIEKQSKEIEELQVNNKKLQDKCKELIFEKQELTSALLDSTPNDKIKSEIEELKNMKVDGEVFITSVNFAIKVLQSLLEKEGE